MRRTLRSLPFARLVSSTLCAVFLSASPCASSREAFRIDEGRNINSFLRDGPVAAHLVLRSGHEPRVLVAFPAGNSGVALWFERTAAPMHWTLVTPPRPISTLDGKGRPLHGIEFEVTTDAAQLEPRAAVLSSIRVLRDFELLSKAPDEVLTPPTFAGGGVSWVRDRLDGASGYLLRVTPRGGATLGVDRFVAGPGAPLRLRFRALSGETPLTPVYSLLARRAAADAREPLSDDARAPFPNDARAPFFDDARAPFFNDARARNALSFLSYREKFLAGSWRFDTYFGRDTMMSAMLLAPVLTPGAMESAISSVLDRLAPDGEAAHEEDICEFAVLRNSREGRGRVATPIYDYGMVDDDFMLAPLAARWLLDDAGGRAHAASFLATQGAGGETRGAALARNLAWLVERAAPFAAEPSAANLVGVKAGRNTGNWRDSEQGLGGGRYPYDVNAALVPAALGAAARLAESGLLGKYLDAGQRGVLAAAGERARIWSTRAPPLFEVDVPAAEARTAMAAYAKEIGVEGEGAVRALGDAPLEFHALSLDADGKAVRILNSDEGFRLLFTEPTAAELERCLTAILRPFPAGLVTDVGVLVANPALASAAQRREFTRFAYHGTVVWSWQQALLMAGIDRQLRRTDLPESARAQLRAARATVRATVENTKSLRTSELWSWSYADGHFKAEPFGRPGADVDESNAAQLWSTVYLGL